MKNREDFIQKVKQIMNDADLYARSNVQFFGADTTQVDYHADMMYEDSWKTALNQVNDLGEYAIPREMFDILPFDEQPLVSDPAQGFGDIHLPEDYYTLYSLRMKGWSKAVTHCFTKENPIYSLQANEFTRGTFVRPIAIYSKILHSYKDENQEVVREPKKVITYYSLPRGTVAKVSEALYIPYPKPLKENLVKNDKLKTILAYLVAANIYRIQEKTEQAIVLETQAYKII